MGVADTKPAANKAPAKVGGAKAGDKEKFQFSQNKVSSIIYLFIHYLFMCLFIYLFIYVFMYVFICLFIYVFIYLFYLFIYLFISSTWWILTFKYCI